jgi:hypothetical protein
MHVRTTRSKQGALCVATQGFTSRVPCIDHGVFTRSPPLLGHDDHADSTIPATSTTVCSATATPQTRLCQLLRQLSARLRRPLRLLQLDHADYFNSRLLGCGDYFDSATNQAKSYFNKYLSIKYYLVSLAIFSNVRDYRQPNRKGSGLLRWSAHCKSNQAAPYECARRVICSLVCPRLLYILHYIFFQ